MYWERDRSSNSANSLVFSAISSSIVMLSFTFKGFNRKSPSRFSYIIPFFRVIS